MKEKFKYSYMPTEECRRYVNISDGIGIESSMTTITFRNQFDREFVFLDRKKLIWFNVTLAIAAYVFGRITG